MRLIDADALWDAVGEIELPRGAYYVAVELQKAFDAAPTIDAVPVVHGEWIMRGGKRYCYACGERACVTRDSDDFWYTVGTRFCPNCGAKMNEEDKDE